MNHLKTPAKRTRCSSMQVPNQIISYPPPSQPQFNQGQSHLPPNITPQRTSYDSIYSSIIFRSSSKPKLLQQPQQQFQVNNLSNQSQFVNAMPIYQTQSPSKMRANSIDSAFVPQQNSIYYQIQQQISSNQKQKESSQQNQQSMRGQNMLSTNNSASKPPSYSNNSGVKQNHVPDLLNSPNLVVNPLLVNANSNSTPSQYSLSKRRQSILTSEQKPILQLQPQQQQSQQQLSQQQQQQQYYYQQHQQQQQQQQQQQHQQQPQQSILQQAGIISKKMQNGHSIIDSKRNSIDEQLRQMLIDNNNQENQEQALIANKTKLMSNSNYNNSNNHSNLNSMNSINRNDQLEKKKQVNPPQNSIIYSSKQKNPNLKEQQINSSQANLQMSSIQTQASHNQTNPLLLSGNQSNNLSGNRSQFSHSTNVPLYAQNKTFQSYNSLSQPTSSKNSKGNVQVTFPIKDNSQDQHSIKLTEKDNISQNNNNYLQQQKLQQIKQEQDSLDLQGKKTMNINEVLEEAKERYGGKSGTELLAERLWAAEEKCLELENEVDKLKKKLILREKEILENEKKIQIVNDEKKSLEFTLENQKKSQGIIWPVQQSEKMSVEQNQSNSSGRQPVQLLQNQSLEQKEELDILKGYVSSLIKQLEMLQEYTDLISQENIKLKNEDKQIQVVKQENDVSKMKASNLSTTSVSTAAGLSAGEVSLINQLKQKLQISEEQNRTLLKQNALYEAQNSILKQEVECSRQEVELWKKHALNTSSPAANRPLPPLPFPRNSFQGSVFLGEGDSQQTVFSQLNDSHFSVRSITPPQQQKKK